MQYSSVMDIPWQSKFLKLFGSNMICISLEKRFHFNKKAFTVQQFPA